MAAGRTFRPGPRVEYRQRARRSDPADLQTTEIASPLDVAAAPGGTLWRQANSRWYRRETHREVHGRRIARTVPIDTITGSIAWTQDDDTSSASGTFTDPAYGDGGIRARQQSAVYRRLRPRVQYLRRAPFDLSVYGTIAWTQDDDTSTAAGAPYQPLPPGGARDRQQSTVYRRIPGRQPFAQRRARRDVGTTDIQGSIAWTQADDTSSASGTFTDPPYGDGLARQRAQSSVYRRVPGRQPFCQRRPKWLAGGITGTAAWTQDDDISSASGDVFDPVPPWRADRQRRAHHRPRPMYLQRPVRELVVASTVEDPTIVPPVAAFLTAARTYTSDYPGPTVTVSTTAHTYSEVP